MGFENRDTCTAHDRLGDLGWIRKVGFAILRYLKKLDFHVVEILYFFSRSIDFVVTSWRMHF